MIRGSAIALALRGGTRSSWTCLRPSVRHLQVSVCLRRTVNLVRSDLRSFAWFIPIRAGSKITAYPDATSRCRAYREEAPRVR